MTSRFADFLRAWLPAPVLQPLRRLKRKWERQQSAAVEPLSMDEFQRIVRDDLKVAAGQSLFIHASVTDLKLDGTPEQVVDFLLDLVGPSGTICMPFYPVKSSHEWLLSGLPFNVKQGRTSMGAVSKAFASREGVKKSLHPTKSVAVYGKDRDHLIADHHRSPMPYGEKSPYGRFAEIPGSRVLGLGVSAARLSCMHVAVDLTPDYPIQPYHPAALTGTVIDDEGHTIAVPTYAHDLELTNREDVPRFLSETKCPTYAEIRRKGRVFFTVETRALVDHTIAQGRKGKTFFYPASLNRRQPPRIPL